MAIICTSNIAFLIATRILFYKYLQYFRFGKMLALSHQHGLAQHTITMVAALSMQEVLLETPIGNNLVFSPNFSILVFFELLIVVFF